LAALPIADDYHGTGQIRVDNGQGLEISHVGNGSLHSHSNSFHLNHVYHVPSISKKLLSVHKFTLDNKCFFEFWPSCFFVKDQTIKQVLLTRQNKDGLYMMPTNQSKVANVATRLSFDDLHNKPGHPHSSIVSKIIRENTFDSISSSLSSKCTACWVGKMIKPPLPYVQHHNKSVLDLIFSDVWSPSATLSNLGFRYFLIIVDDNTRFTWIYFLKHKSDVCSCFLTFQSLVENQFQTKIKAFQSDRGGEFQKFHVYFQKSGIHHRVACPHTHE
jgi:hypothetical protein